MLTWQGVSATRMESARVLWPGGLRVRATGRVIVAATAEHAPYSAEYELMVDERGVVRRLLLRSANAETQRQVSLAHSEDAGWLVDSATGAQRDRFDGALDVDVENMVLFHATPIRRLGLHQEPGEVTLPVISVSLPDLSVRLVRQTYRTESIGPSGAVVNFADDTVDVDLTVAPDGTVLHYPGLARRI